MVQIKHQIVQIKNFLKIVTKYHKRRSTFLGYRKQSTGLLFYVKLISSKLYKDNLEYLHKVTCMLCI